MSLSAEAVSLDQILSWRDHYRQEMNCQVVHDSLHVRQGWTQSYLLRVGTTPVGYGAIAHAGPWKGKPTVFEFYVAPPWRLRVIALFETLLAGSAAVAIEIQNNDPLITPMFHAFVKDVLCEKILFRDHVTTQHTQPGVVFRPMTPADAAPARSQQLAADAHWLLEVQGVIAATGGILYHYNRPYGDIYMDVAEPFRRRGLGAFLVQELKRVCYEGGSIPAARCNPENIGSRLTCQKAGFVPCGNILSGPIFSTPVIRAGDRPA